MKAITDLFENSVRKYYNNAFLWQKTNDKFEALSFGETQKRVYQFSSGLISIGIEKGDRIALLSEGRNDWVISELGILYAGAVNVPLSVKLNEQEIKFRIEHSDARMVIVSATQAKKLTQTIKSIASLEKIIILDDQDNLDSKFLTFSSILEKGQKCLAINPEVFEQRWKAVKPGDFANISYTSGTTADPKGIILTHRNYTANVEQSLTLMNIPSDFVSLMILPLDHAFAHTVGVYVMMFCGASMATVQVGKTPMDTLKNIPLNIRDIKPHLLLSVPSLAKNFRKNIESNIRAKGKVPQYLFQIGLSLSYTYNGLGWNRGKGFRMFLQPLVKLFDKIIFQKVRDAFGGRLEFFVGGGALLDIELQKFFFAIGIPMLQGYGLSESAPVISSNSLAKLKFGSSGTLVKYLDLKICDEDGNALTIGEKGEIVVRGENIMAGYWKNPEATSETLKDGWLYTGDLGKMDKNGFLFVYGRNKSLLIADDGEKYSPEGMEEAIVGQSTYISQCLLYNNQNPYTIALLVLHKDVIRQAVKKNTNSYTAEDAKTILKLIESELNEYRTGRKYGHMFPQRWLPSAIGILVEGFTEDNHLMNSTMKIVRGKITEKYFDNINYLYTPEAKNILNNSNISSVLSFITSNQK